MAPKMQADNQPRTASGSPFTYEYPKISRLTSKRELVHVLKKMITETKNRAMEAALEGRDLRFADLCIVRAWAERKLDDVVLMRVAPAEAEHVLRNALNTLDGVLHQPY